ncbi:beta strand repeat-containing protein [Flavobacterium aquiphilum]|uniref:beta strand repeat-containing protein n=1 Tax=Flavobacterium aquiphilum TaxID=3003261 RepID=UPI00248027E4|nr:hypothetical protein [Flavobacterium aquiphilum]
MSINHNRIKVADLEKNEANKILITNSDGELEFVDINNTLDCTLPGKVLDARQGKVLKDLVDNINVLLTSDNVNLNTIQELVDATTSIQTQLNSKASDANVLHKTDNESWTGIKSSTNTGATSVNGLSLTNSGTGGTQVINISNTSTGRGVFITNSSTGQGQYVNNGSGGNGIYVQNQSTGTGYFSDNQSTGVGVILNSQTSSTGDLIQFRKNNILVSRFDQNGKLSIGGANMDTMFNVSAEALDTAALNNYNDTQGFGAILFRRYTGTRLAPSGITTSAVIGGMIGAGSYSGGTLGSNTVAIRMLGNGVFTPTSQPTMIDFATTSVSSTTRTERMRIESTGNVLIGTTTDNGIEKLQVNGSSIFTGRIITNQRLTTEGNYSSIINNAGGVNLEIAARTITNNTAAASSTTTQYTAAGFGVPTFSATNTGITYTNASNLYIAGAPIAGTNVTITNPWALYVNSGNSYFGGEIQTNNTIRKKIQSAGTSYPSISNSEIVIGARSNGTDPMIASRTNSTTTTGFFQVAIQNADVTRTAGADMVFRTSYETGSDILQPLTTAGKAFEFNNSNPLLSIFRNGNVNIGSTGTDNGYKLEVEGTSKFNNNVLISNTGVAPTTPYQFNIEGSNALALIKRNSSLAIQSPKYLFDRTGATITTDISAGYHLGGVHFRGLTGGTMSDWGLLSYVASSTTAGQGYLSMFKSDLTSEVFRINNSNGNIIIQNGGTFTDNGYRLDVQGTTNLNGNTTLQTTPTTSASNYDFLTRNSSTGVVEKVPSNSFVTSISPTFTGTPTAPTASVGTNTTQIATTAFVTNAITSNVVTLSGTQNILGAKTFSTAYSGFSSGTGFQATFNTANGVFEMFTTTAKPSIYFSDGGTTVGAIFDCFAGSTGNHIIGKNNNVTNFTLDKLGNVTATSVTGIVKLKQYTVATLPVGTQGDTAYVTDATSPTYLGTLTGGGSVKCPVFYNGTAWVSH